MADGWLAVQGEVGCLVCVSQPSLWLQGILLYVKDTPALQLAVQHLGEQLNAAACWAACSH